MDNKLFEFSPPWTAETIAAGLSVLTGYKVETLDHQNYTRYWVGGNFIRHVIGMPIEVWVGWLEDESVAAVLRAWQNSK